MAIRRLTQEQKSRLRSTLAALHEERSEDFDELSEETQHAITERTADRGDEGAAEWNEQMELGLLEGEDKNLQEVADALRRLDEGTYGVCEECGDAIAFERLEALPWVRMCMSCQAEIERNGGGEEARPSPGSPHL